ncbi:hypothetical protein PVT71_09525 [Salipiger sp. H15]|uniref:Uncharacterized protein n=1 Tax=Alloyangia sp. H15 TaxID=3029062 RepID=A0AAU8ADV1_9RHOB
MVGSFLFRAIEDYAHAFDLPVVYSGDHLQVPPVSDREVIMDQGFETITLRRSIRFPEDSDIFRLGELLRHAIEYDPDGELPMLYSFPSVRVASGNEWIARLTDGYRNHESLLAVSSQNDYLRRMRKKLRSAGHSRLAAGDAVVSKQTDGHFLNGEQFTVSSVQADKNYLPDVPTCVSHNRTLAISGYRLTFRETEREAFIVEGDQQLKELEEHIRHLHHTDYLPHADAARILD